MKLVARVERKWDFTGDRRRRTVITISAGKDIVQDELFSLHTGKPIKAARSAVRKLLKPLGLEGRRLTWDKKNFYFTVSKTSWTNRAFRVYLDRVSMMLGELPIPSLDEIIRVCSCFSSIEDLEQAMIDGNYVPTLKPSGLRRERVRDEMILAVRDELRLRGKPVFPAWAKGDAPEFEVKEMRMAKKHSYTVVRTWPSSTNPDKRYELRMGADEEIYCNCMAWRFSKKSPKICKHMEQWADQVAKNGNTLIG